MIYTQSPFYSVRHYNPFNMIYKTFHYPDIYIHLGQSNISSRLACYHSTTDSHIFHTAAIAAQSTHQSFNVAYTKYSLWSEYQ